MKTLKGIYPKPKFIKMQVIVKVIYTIVICNIINLGNFFGSLREFFINSKPGTYSKANVAIPNTIIKKLIKNHYFYFFKAIIF